MKKNIKKKKKNHIKIFLIMLPLTALALYILHIASAYDTSDGVIFISYSSTYPLILLGEYALITVLLFPFILNSKKEPELNLFILPLMLFGALGMMRLDSATPVTSTEADYDPSIMFIILFITLVVMAFSGHTLSGILGTLTGTALFPAFGICFSPFITAAAFIFNKEKKKEHLVSTILNGALSVGAFIYGAIKLEITDISFSKKYVPVIFLALAFAAFTLFRKEYKLLPLSILPLFPLLSGMAFGTFPTPLFTLSASVAPFVILLGTAALKGENEKITGYAKELSHNPVIYIIVAVFILHTADVKFVNPGYFRHFYK